MFKKALQKLRKIASKEPETPKTKLSSSPSPRLLTAEGWKRLMMKKPRKS
jgi:hypothetical protein